MMVVVLLLSDFVIEWVGFGLFVFDCLMIVLMWNCFMQDYSGILVVDVIGCNLFDCFLDLLYVWLLCKFESVFQFGSFVFSLWEQWFYLFCFEYDWLIMGGVDYMQQDCMFMLFMCGCDVEVVCVMILDVMYVSVM